MPASAEARLPRARWWATITANPRGAVYGVIVATAVIAAADTGNQPARITLAETVTTLLVFWLAHVYAELIARGLHDGRRELKAIPASMAKELSMIAAPGLSILFLLLGTLGLLDEGVAVRLALWSGVVQLIGWGITVERRAGESWPAALLGGLVNGALGLVIVVLEVFLH
jgi:hypothetical protein